MNTRYGLMLLALTVLTLGVIGCGREEAEKAKKELEETKISLAKLQDEVKATKKAFTELEEQYKGVNEELQAAKKSTLDAKSKLQAVEKQLADAKEDAKQKQSAAGKEINDLKKQVADLKKANSISVTEQKSAVALAAKLRRENTQLQSDVEKLQEEVRQLRGIKPSATDKPADADDENLPKIPTTAPVKKLPDPTNPEE